MLVCVCKAINDQKLEELIQEGHQTVELIEKACGAGGDCGACKRKLEQRLQQTQQGQTSLAGIKLSPNQSSSD